MSPTRVITAIAYWFIAVGVLLLPSRSPAASALGLGLLIVACGWLADRALFPEER